MQLHSLHLVGIDIATHQSGTVSGYPKVTTAVACHAVDTTVSIQARHTQLVADGRVPCVGLLVVKHQRALSIEPDIIHLVGESLQRLTVTQLMLRDKVSLPDNVLLVRDITTHDAAVSVHQQRSVATLAQRAYLTRRHTACIGTIAEFVVLLLLHVIGHHALAGHHSPQVLMLVDINQRRDIAINTHLGIDLLHVALEALCLRVIDADTRQGTNPQRTLQTLLDTDDIAVEQ